MWDPGPSPLVTTGRVVGWYLVPTSAGSQKRGLSWWHRVTWGRRGWLGSGSLVPVCSPVPSTCDRTWSRAETPALAGAGMARATSEQLGERGGCSTLQGKAPCQEGGAHPAPTPSLPLWMGVSAGRNSRDLLGPAADCSLPPREAPTPGTCCMVHAVPTQPPSPTRSHAGASALHTCSASPEQPERGPGLLAISPPWLCWCSGLHGITPCGSRAGQELQTHPGADAPRAAPSLALPPTPMPTPGMPWASVSPDRVHLRGGRKPLWSWWVTGQSWFGSQEVMERVPQPHTLPQLSADSLPHCLPLSPLDRAAWPGRSCW